MHPVHVSCNILQCISIFSQNKKGVAFVPMYPHWLVWTHREGDILKCNAYNLGISDENIK